MGSIITRKTKFLFIVLLFVGVFIGALILLINRENSKSDIVCPPTIKVQGQYYYCFYEKADPVPEEYILGEIKSIVPISQPPEEEEQGNSKDFLGAAYAFYEGNMYLRIEEQWYVCEEPENDGVMTTPELVTTQPTEELPELSFLSNEDERTSQAGPANDTASIQNAVEGVLIPLLEDRFQSDIVEREMHTASGFVKLLSAKVGNDIVRIVLGGLVIYEIQDDALVDVDALIEPVYLREDETGNIIFESICRISEPELLEGRSDRDYLQQMLQWYEEKEPTEEQLITIQNMADELIAKKYAEMGLEYSVVHLEETTRVYLADLGVSEAVLQKLKSTAPEYPNWNGSILTEYWGRRVKYETSFEFARHGRALTGESPEYA
ncbi:MAG: hypothetical protein IJ744_12655 [Lachnospiraceae bacterium]|nr:hypothetical protein [Lachnospiraceae bacterium]